MPSDAPSDRPSNIPSSIPSTLCVNEYKKTVKGSKLVLCGQGQLSENVKKSSKMPYNEGYFEIVTANPIQENHGVIDQSTEEYYNTITSGSPRFIRHVAIAVGSIMAIFGNV
jgi:hypothetical protein